MNVRNCNRCGKIYNYDGFRLCIQCRRNDEGDFQKVKEYLYENPGANVAEVSEQTEVSTRKIIEFLKEGRLEIKDENNILLECEKCGTPIKTGRFCDKCTISLQKELRQAVARTKDPKDLGVGRAKEKIRITDRYNK
ncbi:MerR family transcriptional regulator [Tissierella sp. MSJ-40]|uniref:MerR family transcriptional regulator n=1 Tax=Tissierella simiarum TaxID=2841534 RepID=A0ABS6E1A6_9FIRM|nr:TIGR03826 family flagellar region protein [Tissierella simiarum]MBU5436681.1 MerR family transcriptional regulator [Tissierella simiarum]